MENLRLSEGLNYQITQFLIWLLSLVPAQDALVDGLTAFEAFFHAMPELDLLFSVFPAQQHNLVLHHAGEIQKPNIEIFDLHANSINFCQRILDVLERLVAFCAPPRHRRHVDEKATAQ